MQGLVGQMGRRLGFVPVAVKSKAPLLGLRSLSFPSDLFFLQAFRTLLPKTLSGAGMRSCPFQAPTRFMTPMSYCTNDENFSMAFQTFGHSCLGFLSLPVPHSHCFLGLPSSCISIFNLGVSSDGKFYLHISSLYNSNPKTPPLQNLPTLSIGVSVSPIPILYFFLFVLLSTAMVSLVYTCTDLPFHRNEGFLGAEIVSC